ncbi:hypothetical protein I5M27_09400 [Adhaeribacter sp. BT258]|uniref:YD repeat-containing protein n=1 Tax=Adhaeribacter terrigena TaxID=2793070 RepID=A0ABS1C1J8_9BACT|nr:hypothetical protein [Adhaeribacter terrigena]MBK0403200.1 hypothetical protein [Adhaeribacter terrigena]
MTRFTTKNFLALALSALVLFSCGKDDDKTATPNNPNNPGNPSNQKCRITNAMEDDGDETIFEYDSQRRLIKQSYKDNGVLDTYYDTYEYNAAGYISKSIEWEGTKMEEYSLYTYNNDGRLTKRESFYNNGTSVVLDDIITYEYDSNKRLIKKNYYGDASLSVIEEYSTYSYPSANTAREMSYYDRDGDGTVEHASTADYTFDDKKSPQLLLGVAFDDEFISEHNVTREVYTDPSGTGTPSIYTYSYEYNAEGFPTKITVNYTGSSPDITTISYNCN